MADHIIVRDSNAHRPLSHERLRPSWEGGKVTNTEARALVSKLRGWASQFHHPEASVLSVALDDVERCFEHVATEIDEALTRIHLMKHDPRNAADHLDVALSYLHRWQDRGGRVGNFDTAREASHG